MCHGREGRVIAVQGDGFDFTADVLLEDRPNRLSAVCLPDAVPGDWVMVHSGYVIGRRPDPDLHGAKGPSDIGPTG